MKRFWSIFLCIVMILTALSITVGAEEEENVNASGGYVEFTTTFPENATNGHYFYYKLFDLGDYKLRDGDFLDYEVWISEPTAGFGALDIISADPEGGTLRDDPGSVDQNFISGHPSSDLSPVACQEWYHRRVQISSRLINKTGGWVVVAADLPTGVTKLAGKTVTVRYRNIKITNMKKETTLSIYEGDAYTMPEDVGVMDGLNGIPGSVSDVKIIEGNAPEEPLESTGESTTDGDKSAGGIPSILWAVIAAVVIVVGIPAVIIIVYLIKKKKKG